MPAASKLCEQAVQELFTQVHLRFTRQRYAIYHALASVHSHPTVDELFQMLAQANHDISLATVYNTLEALVKSGLVRKLSDGGTSARYDATVDDHLHVRDKNTGTVADVPADLGQRLLKTLPNEVLKQIEIELGFKINHVEIELVGEYASSKTHVA